MTRARIALTGTVIAGIASVVLAGVLGTYPISLEQLIAVLTGNDTGFASTVVLEWRLPRALAALAIGAALGISGELLQLVTRNPLASPDLIGISGGSFTAVLLVTVFGASSWAITTPAALIGGFASAAIVFLLSGAKAARAGAHFLLAGVALAALFGGINGWVVRSASLDSAMAASVWGAGSLAASTWQTVLLATLSVLVGGALTALAVQRAHVYVLGEDLATALGSAPTRLRIELLLISVGLAAVATALVGPIGLLALIAPPIAKRLSGAPSPAVALSAASGAVILSVADLLAQHAVPGGPPAGLVTTVLGGLYLLLLLLRSAPKGSR